MIKSNVQEKQSEPGGKRIEAMELRAKDRQALQEIVPLSTPFVVYIDPTNKCNFLCEFCPTADKPLLRQVGRPGATMSMELFKKIIADLKAFERPLKLLSLYKDGEPTMNKNFPEMVRHAKEQKVAERIWTKTNGSQLRPEFNQKIIDAGLDMIHISVESTSAEGFYRVAKAKIDYDLFVENIADLYRRRGNCKIYIKIADDHLTKEEIEKFYADFQPISDFIAIERLMGWSHSEVKDFTLGMNPTTYDGLPLIPKIACAYPFYVMAVNADGSVSVCGNDWSYKTTVGNVKERQLTDIWNGEEMFQFRKMMLEGRRGENAACKNCYYLQIVPDNIDDHREAMLKRLGEDRELRAGCSQCG